MRIGVRPTVDVVFKRIFGGEDSAPITLCFLNSLLPLIGCPKAASVEILNPWRLAEFRGDKEVAVDVRARDEQGRDFQIEMQVRPEPVLSSRMLDNWARLYAGQIGRGEGYERHRPALALWFLGHSHFSDPAWLHAFRLVDGATGIPLEPPPLIVTIELPKRAALPDFGEGTILNGGIDEWLYFLSRGEELDLESAPFQGAVVEIREALNIMSVFTKQERARHTYEKRLDYERSLKGMLEAARAEGLAEGKAEMARRLRELGVSPDLVTEAIGLPDGSIGEA